MGAAKLKLGIMTIVNSKFAFGLYLRLFISALLLALVAGRLDLNFFKCYRSFLYQAQHFIACRHQEKL